MKIKGMTEKYVLREVAKPVLTRRGRTAAEASVPLAAGDAADGGLALRADSGHAARPGPRAHGHYDRKKVVALLDRFRR
jgi:hypothetical protein